jgi:hypothetical protein
MQNCTQLSAGVQPAIDRSSEVPESLLPDGGEDHPILYVLAADSVGATAEPVDAAAGRLIIRASR